MDSRRLLELVEKCIEACQVGDLAELAGLLDVMHDEVVEAMQSAAAPDERAWARNVMAEVRRG